MGKERSLVAKKFNKIDDYFSKPEGFDDYAINDDVLHMLDQKWGPHWFACSFNAKLSRFNARLFQPEIEEVDAFTQN